MKPNSLQLLIILSVTLCMAAGSFSAQARVALGGRVGANQITSR